LPILTSQLESIVNARATVNAGITVNTGITGTAPVPSLQLQRPDVQLQSLTAG